MHPSLLYFPGALLSQPELSAARLDGVLFEVGDGYMPPDIPEDSVARVSSLGHILLPGYAASGPTAAWVHGAGSSSPARHHLQRITTHRQRVDTPRGVTLHDGLLAPDEFAPVGGIAVTTPLRTLIDLALAASSDRTTAGWARIYAAYREELVIPAIAHLEARQRLPRKRAALVLLNSMRA